MPRTKRRRPVKAAKKPALSNKELTRRVRSLEQLDGQLVIEEDTLISSGTTLTAGTANLSFFTSVADGDRIFYIDYYIKLLAASTATLRMIWFDDSSYNAGAAVVSDILKDTTDSTSSLSDTGQVAPLWLAKHKNASETYKCYVRKELMIPMIAGEYKAMIVRINYHRKRIGNQDTDGTPWLPSLLCLADEANITATVKCNASILRK